MSDPVKPISPQAEALAKMLMQPKDSQELKLHSDILSVLNQELARTHNTILCLKDHSQKVEGVDLYALQKKLLDSVEFAHLALTQRVEARSK